MKDMICQVGFNARGFPGGFHQVHPINAPSASEIPMEIAAMREMGVWTEEDESAVAGPETGLSEIEFFQRV